MAESVAGRSAVAAIEARIPMNDLIQTIRRAGD
jgi:hypothetical protein